MIGVTLFLDYNENGQLDGQPTAVTAADDPSTPDVDEAGTYHFTGVVSGEQRVRQVAPSAFGPLVPSERFYSFTMEVGEIRHNVDFGNIDVLPQVIGSSILQGHVVPPGPLTYVATFDTLLKIDELDAEDVNLRGTITGSHVPLSLEYDPASAMGPTVTLRFDELPEDRYSLTLHSGTNYFEGLFGADLDGEVNSLTTVPSGDGKSGGTFSFSFDVDTQTDKVLAFERGEPAGSLMRLSKDHSGGLHVPSDVDEFTFSAERGELITAVVSPKFPNVRLSIELVGVAGPVQAAKAGEPALLPPTEVPSDGVYTIRVTGNAATLYELQVGRNGVLESPDTEDGTELPIDASQSSLATGRYAVEGTGLRHVPIDARVWCVQPATGRILVLDPATGVVLESFPAPDALSPEHTHIGLTIADNGRSLLYVNADVDPTALYRLDPLTGEVLAVETIAAGNYAGLGSAVLRGPDVIYWANMDTNPGWTLEGDWAYGKPTGGGRLFFKDPTSGSTGLNVIGYNLTAIMPTTCRRRFTPPWGPACFALRSSGALVPTAVRCRFECR